VAVAVAVVVVVEVVVVAAAASGTARVKRRANLPHKVSRSRRRISAHPGK